jgi:hypothetical protein
LTRTPTQDNDRKGGYGGAKIRANEVRPIAWAVVLTNIPFLVYFAITLPWLATLWMGLYAFSFWQYSATPLRFKGRPIWDSVSNADYAFPLVFVPYALGAEPIWAAAIGLMAWSMAKHVYDAIQDIDEDATPVSAQQLSRLAQRAPGVVGGVVDGVHGVVRPGEHPGCRGQRSDRRLVGHCPVAHPHHAEGP